MHLMVDVRENVKRQKYEAKTILLYVFANILPSYFYANLRGFFSIVSSFKHPSYAFHIHFSVNLGRAKRNMNFEVME